MAPIARQYEYNIIYGAIVDPHPHSKASVTQQTDLSVMEVSLLASCAIGLVCTFRENCGTLDHDATI